MSSVDYFMNYDPQCTERHSDSSDFEESGIKIGRKKKQNMFRKNRSINLQTEDSKIKKESLNMKILEDSNNRASNRKSSSKESVNRIGNHKQLNNLVYKIENPVMLLEEQNNVEDSHLFQGNINNTSDGTYFPFPKEKRKSRNKKNNPKHFMSNDQEIYCVKNVYDKCNSKKRKELFTIQPVLTIDGNIYGLPLHSTQSGAIFKSSSYCNLTSSDDSMLKKKKNKRNQYKPRKMSKSAYKSNPYQIYNTNSLFRTKATSCEELAVENSVVIGDTALTGSEVWNYVAKQTSVSPKTSHCDCGTSPMPCGSLNCGYTSQDQYNPVYGCNHVPLFVPPNFPNPFPYPNHPIPPGVQTKQCPCCGLKINHPQGGWAVQPNAITAKSKHKFGVVSCECPMTVNAQRQAQGLAMKPQGIVRQKPQNPTQPARPQVSKEKCQQSHDKMVKCLKDKYNGEVLCIHNPPCVLINGCLNVTTDKQPKQQQQRVVNKKMVCNFTNMTDFIKDKCDQPSQYSKSFLEELVTCKTSIREQMTQSICYHDPPCEVVPRCYNQIGRKCGHIPPCPMAPACVMDANKMINYATGFYPNQNGKSVAEHRTWCPKPMLVNFNDNFRYGMIPKEDASTQVKPKMKIVCRHKPPCILIPKCVSRMNCDSYLPHNLIPDCRHSPKCELVPACCRKCPKRMTSNCSQFPAACRIV